MTVETNGLVCAHHHLYSSLARGMPAPPETPTNFLSVLKNIWWRLDAALDLDIIYWSAALGAAEAALAGTTAVIDHHESPSAIEGSLDAIKAGCDLVGVRTNLCYGVTDRWGDDGIMADTRKTPQCMTDAARRGLDECNRFLSEGNRGMVGVHAAFTCSDDTLHAAADLARRHNVGVHIHVAEGVDDIDAGARLTDLAADDWLLVHCVHLDRTLRGTIAHNARSNMNNAVGYAAPSRSANRVVLGTDGIGGNMQDEARITYARLREFDICETPDTVWQWLANGEDLMPEVKRDRVVWNYDHPDSAWHSAFTTTLTPTDVYVDGTCIVADGELAQADITEIRQKAAEAATRLHSRL